MARAPKTPSTLDVKAVAKILAHQKGVISRRQVLAHGGREADIRKQIRRREWAQLFPGVYVNHTGAPTREQRWWGAVLLNWPAWLHRESALEAHGIRSDRRGRAKDAPVFVMVDAGRAPRSVDGVTVERVRGAARWGQDNKTPPRARLEFAALKAAAAKDLEGAVALLSDACQQRRTTPERLLTAARTLMHLPGRALLVEILEDVSAGTRSVLEWRYLTLVERAHGLPVGTRQLKAIVRDGVAYRDVEYVAFLLRVELDGRFGHTDSADRWDDLERDLESATGEVLTLRPGWRQVLDPCRLADLIGAVLIARGWDGVPTPCSDPECDVRDRVGLQSPGDCDSTHVASPAQ